MKRLIGMLGACALLLVNSLALAADAGKERAEIRKASAKVLADLYKAKPSAKQVVESAAGYATFTNFGMKLLVAGGGTGKGMAVRKGKDGGRQEVFMRMAEVQAGLGIGIKKFKLVFVFDSAAAFDRFVSSGGGRKQGRGQCRRDSDVGGHLAVPDDRQGAGARSDDQGHQVLQGQGSQLGIPFTPRRGAG